MGLSQQNPSPMYRRAALAVALGAAVTAGAVFAPAAFRDPVLASGPNAEAARANVAAPFRLENVVPSSALFYASIDDVPAFIEALKSTATFRTWLDPEFQAFLGDAVRSVQSKIEEGHARIERETGLDLRVMRTMIAGQAAVAVLPPAGGESRFPRLLASIELGDNVGRFREISRAILEKAREASGGEISSESYTYEGTTVESIRFGGDGDAMHATVIGSALVVSSDEDALNDAIERTVAAARPRDTLGSAARFRNVMSKVNSADGESVIAYADVAGAIAAFAPAMSGNDRAVLDALGVTDVRAIGLATTLARDGVFDTVFIDTPAEKRGILRLLEMPQGPLATIDSAPEGTLLYFGVHIDPREIASEVRRIAAIAEPGSVEEMDRGLAEAREKLGFDPIEDLVGSFGDEFSFFLRAPNAGVIPDMALVAKLADPEKLERTLAKIEELVRREAGEQLPFTHKVSALAGGGRLHTITPQHVPFAIHLGIDGGMAAIGPQASTVKDALAGQGGGLRRDPQFVSGLRLLDARPDSGFGSLAYVNLRDGLGYLYNVASPFIAGWRPRSSGVPLDMALLPSVEALTRHMTPIVQTFRSEGDGFFARSVSPTGNTFVIYATLGAIVLGY